MPGVRVALRGRHRSQPLSHDDPSSIAPPDVIGPYRVLHQIGSGVLGPVFRAVDPDADRIVAIKLFRLDWPPEQARAVAGALQTLIETLPPHENIAQPLASGMEGGAAWLAQEFVGADGLEARLRRRTPVGADEALLVVRQVAAALDVAAAAGWRHGALHPRDVLVDTSGRVRVTGIGVAQIVERFGARIPKRRPYAAPERAVAAGWDHRADVFALATIAAELLGPRRGRGQSEASRATVLTEAGFDGPRAGMVLDRGMSNVQAERFASATFFVEALTATIGVPEDPPPGPGPLFEPERIADRAPEADAPAPVEPEAGRVDDVAPHDLDLALPAAAAFADGHHPVDEFTHAPVAAAPMSPDEADPLDEPRAAPPAESRVTLGDADGRDSVDAAPPLDLGVAPLGAAESETPWGLGTEPAAVPSFGAGDGDAGRRSPVVFVLLGALLLLAALGGYLYSRRGANGAPSPVPQASAPTERAEVTEAPIAGEAGPPESRPAPGPTGAASSGAVAPASPAPSAVPSSPVVPSPRASAPAAATPVPPSTDKAAGRLRVRTSPAGARVKVNGADRGATPLSVRDLAYGSYTLEISRNGYRDESRRVRLSAKSPSATLDVRLRPERASRPAPAAAATPAGKPAAPVTNAGPAGASTGAKAALQFDTRPSGARVFVDGTAVGVSPMTLADVAPGAKAIRFELAGHAPWSVTVTLAPGESRRVTASLEPLR